MLGLVSGPTHARDIQSRFSPEGFFMSNLVPVVLSDVAIRQDVNGRYCINDLHKAAGEEARHRPNYWLENQQTIDLAKECEIAGIPAIVAKQGLGTFVVKELVYAYAAWISPAFHVKVLRTFDAVATGKYLAPTAPPAALTPIQIGAQVVTVMMDIANTFGVPKSFALQVASQAAARQSGMMEWTYLLNKSTCMNDVPDEDVMLEPSELGARFGMSARGVNIWLADCGLQYRANGHWRLTDAGKPLARAHAWSTTHKSGYNFKWRLSAIEDIYNSRAAA
jgi:hypothetical protein